MHGSRPSETADPWGAWRVCGRLNPIHLLIDRTGLATYFSWGLQPFILLRLPATHRRLWGQICLVVTSARHRFIKRFPSFVLLWSFSLMCIHSHFFFFSPPLNLAFLTGVQGHFLPSASPAVIDKFREHSKSLMCFLCHFWSLHFK